MKVVFSFILVLAIALIAVRATKLTWETKSMNVDQNENSVAYSHSERKLPGDKCTGDLTDRTCEFENLLLCVNETCSCPEMDHEEVTEFMAVLGFVPPAVTSRFAVNTTWNDSKKRCVGLEGSLCVTDNLPAQVQLPVKIECDAGLPCRPYPDESLQKLIGRCSASALSIVSITQISSLTLLAILVKYCTN